MSNLAQVDWLFTREGYWKNVFPTIVAHCFTMVGVAYISVGKAEGRVPFPVIVAGVVTIIFVVDYIRYRFAAKMHEELKSEFGDAYLNLIEREGLVVNANSILLVGAPNSLARPRLEKEREKRKENS